MRSVSFFWLTALGIMLAFNIGESHSTIMRATTRNPATIALTTLIRESAPEPLYRLEQHVLHYLTLGPTALLLGLVASAALGRRRALLGVVLWIAFAATFSVLLLLEFLRWDLRWYSAIPDIVGIWCSVPIFLIGVAAGQFAFSPRRWRFTLLDLLAAIGVTSLLSFAAITQFAWMPPLLFLVVASGISLRLYYFPSKPAGNSELLLSSLESRPQ